VLESAFQASGLVACEKKEEKKEKNKGKGKIKL
jgi:hypothetical protein